MGPPGSPTLAATQHTLHQPLSASCGWWAYWRVDPGPLFRLCPIGKGKATRCSPPGLAPEWDPSSANPGKGELFHRFHTNRGFCIALCLVPHQTPNLPFEFRVFPQWTRGFVPCTWYNPHLPICFAWSSFTVAKIIFLPYNLTGSAKLMKDTPRKPVAQLLQHYLLKDYMSQ